MARSEAVIGVLRRWNVLLDGEQGELHWNPVRKSTAPNNPVLIDGVRRICVFDHVGEDLDTL